MYTDLNDSSYDFFILGSSLAESLLSNNVSLNGKKVIHFDVSKFYGGDCKTLNGRDLKNFLADLRDGKEIYFRNATVLKNEADEIYSTDNFRDYNFDLNIKFLYSNSKATDAFATSRAASYMEFMSSKSNFLYFDGKMLKIPCTKSEIFISEDLELEEKQALLNFIHSALKLKNNSLSVNSTLDYNKDLEVEEKLLSDLNRSLHTNADTFLSERFSSKLHVIIKNVLGNCDPNDKNISLNDLLIKVCKYLTSLQIYDTSPFLMPIYGSSEFSQSVCRMSSLNSTIFIVNENLRFLVEKQDTRYKIVVTDNGCEQTFTIFAEKIVFNETFLEVDQLQFTDPLQIASARTNYFGRVEKYYKFTAIFAIKSFFNSRRNKEGPILFKFPKGCKDFNSEYGFNVYEFFPNTNSAPKNRSLLQLVIFSKEYLDTSICTSIADKFIEFYIKKLRLEFEELKREPTKEEIIAKLEKLLPDDTAEDIKVIFDLRFLQNILYFKEETFVFEESLVVTKNDFENVDLDTYYDSADFLIKKLNIVQIDKPKEEKEDQQDFEDQEVDLIDDLFREFSTVCKEEEKETLDEEKTKQIDDNTNDK